MPPITPMLHPDRAALVPASHADGSGGIAFSPGELDAAYGFVEHAQAPATRRAYLSDVALFSAWCAERRLACCPADPATVAVFLADEARRGVRPTTLSRRLAALRAAHLAAGLEPPTAAEEVRRVLRGIRRASGVRPTRKAPATAERLLLMVAQLPGDSLAGLRDRAILLVGFAGAFRRSELAALHAADLEESTDGLRVTVRRSKTDQDGAGECVPVIRGRTACPVTALRAWLDAAGIADGPVFRPLARGGRRALPVSLTPYSIGVVVKRAAALAGLDPAAFGGHSLRAGFLTSAAERGKPLDRMMAVSRHRRVDTLLGYIRRADDWRDHAGEGLL